MVRIYRSAQVGIFFPHVKLALMTFNTGLKELLLFRWLQKLKPDSSYDSFRSCGQLSLVGNAPNIIQNKSSFTCTNLWYIKKTHPLFLHKHLTFGHSLVKLHFLWCTPGEQSTAASFWKYYWGRLKEPKSLFLYGVFHTKHKHWGVLTELLCPPAVYAYDIGQLYSFGWNSTLDRKFLTYWGVWSVLVNKNETI